MMKNTGGLLRKGSFAWINQLDAVLDEDVSIQMSSYVLIFYACMSNSDIKGTDHLYTT